MADKKTANLEYFRTQLPRFLEDPLLRHKFIVINEQKVHGTFDTFDAALRDALSKFSPDEFVIQQVIGQDEVINFLRGATP